MDTITFLCNEEYVPSTVINSRCFFGGFWIPDPVEHNCTLVIGKLSDWYGISKHAINYVLAILCTCHKISLTNLVVIPSTTAIVELNLVQEEKMFPFFDCPNDILVYNCSVYSNTEDLHVSWQVYLQDGRILFYTHNSSSFMDVTYLDSNIISTLTYYDESGYLESKLQLSLLKGVMLNGTVIECGIYDLNIAEVTVFTNTSGMEHSYSYPIILITFLQ